MASRDIKTWIAIWTQVDTLRMDPNEHKKMKRTVLDEDNNVEEEKPKKKKEKHSIVSHTRGMMCTGRHCEVDKFPQKRETVLMNFERVGDGTMCAFWLETASCSAVPMKAFWGIPPGSVQP